MGRAGGVGIGMPSCGTVVLFTDQSSSNRATEIHAAFVAAQSLSSAALAFAVVGTESTPELVALAVEHGVRQPSVPPSLWWFRGAHFLPDWQLATILA